MKIVVALALAVLLALGWVFTVNDIVGTKMEYNSYIEEANNSFEGRLYEQAVELYEKALAIDSSDVSVYVNIKDAYKAYYQEQQTSDAKTKYRKALISCCESMPEDCALWEELIGFYYDSQDYKSAYKYVKSADKNSASSEYIEEIRDKILSMYTLHTQLFNQYTYAQNGTYIVYDGTSYTNVGTDCKAISLAYDYIGGIGDGSYAIYKDASGFTVRDSDEISRARIDFEIEDSGFFSDDIAPIKANGKYIYINIEGKDAGLGSFDRATSMYSGSAAVSNGGKWGIVDSKGNLTVACKYDDIALNMYGCYTSGNFYAAAENGKYMLFDLTGTKIGSFSCADIDISTDKEWFAYKDAASGLWGYADSTGTVIIKPQYADAKAFSNGYAAVMSDEGFWGFIDKDGDLLIDCTFTEAGYFSKDATCIVASATNRYSLLEFKYNS